MTNNSSSDFAGVLPDPGLARSETAVFLVAGVLPEGYVLSAVSKSSVDKTNSGLTGGIIGLSFGFVFPVFMVINHLCLILNLFFTHYFKFSDCFPFPRK